MSHDIATFIYGRKKQNGWRNLCRLMILHKILLQKSVKMVWSLRSAPSTLHTYFGTLSSSATIDEGNVYIWLILNSLVSNNTYFMFAYFQ